MSHFGSMMGRSSGLAEARVTVPRERGATMAARMLAYCSNQSSFLSNGDLNILEIHL